MSRVLLVLPTSTYRAEDFLRAAEAVNVEVVVASERRQALSAAMGDRALRIDLRRPAAAAAAIVEFAARLPLDAVVAVDEQGVEVAALAAARLGLAHNPPAAVRRARDKTQLRTALAAAGVAQPAFAVAGPGEDVGALAEQVGLPSVIKPVSLSGSRGVIRADDAGEAAVAAARIREIVAAAGADPASPLLVERFVPGREVAVEGLLRGGRLEVLALFDKPDPLDGPYFEETLYVTPSRLEAPVQEAIAATTAAAAAALGLVEGPIHAELRLTPSGPVVLEVAARSIGGLCGRALRFGLGVSLEEVILRRALGLPLFALAREEAASGVMMLPIPERGVLQAVRGQAEARAVPGISGLNLTINPGRAVQPLPEGDRYLGFLFARGRTPEGVEHALRTAHAALDVQIERAPVATGRR